MCCLVEQFTILQISLDFANYQKRHIESLNFMSIDFVPCFYRYGPTFESFIVILILFNRHPPILSQCKISIPLCRYVLRYCSHNLYVHRISGCLHVSITKSCLIFTGIHTTCNKHIAFQTWDIIPQSVYGNWGSFKDTSERFCSLRSSNV